MTGDRTAGKRAGHRIHGFRLGDVERLAGHRHADAEDPAAAAGAFREREDPDVLRAVEQACGFGRILDDPEAGRLRRGLEGEARLDGYLVRRRETAQELAKLEPVEHPPRTLVVVARPARTLELQLDGHVANDRHHPLAEPYFVGVGLERGLQPAFGKLVHPLQEGFDGDEVLNQLGRRLVADARDPGNVVGCVAAQRFEVDQLRGLEAVSLTNLIRPVQEGVGDAPSGDQRFHGLGHQLKTVEVARDYRDRVAALFGDASERADDVVGLEAFDSVDRDRKGFEHLADHFDLRAQVVGHGTPAGLVLLIFLGAECGLAKIEGGDRVLRARGKDDREHRREAVDGIGHLSVRRAHRRQGEKSSIDEAVGVDQNHPPPPTLRHVRILRTSRVTPTGGLERSNRRDGEDRRVIWNRG